MLLLKYDQDKKSSIDNRDIAKFPHQHRRYNQRLSSTKHYAFVTGVVFENQAEMKP